MAYSRLHLLIIDEIGYMPITREQANLSPVEVACISSVYPTHYFQEIAFWSFEDKVIMIIHKDKAVKQYVVTIMVIFQDFEESKSIRIVKKDTLSLITSACYMI